MHVLMLPFFLFLLAAKNVESWLRIAMEAFGAQAVIVTLIIINAGVGALLHRELRQHRHIGEYQASVEAHVERHRQFWSDLAKEYPEHTTVKAALKTINEE